MVKNRKKGVRWFSDSSGEVEVKNGNCVAEFSWREIRGSCDIGSGIGNRIGVEIER